MTLPCEPDQFSPPVSAAEPPEAGAGTPPAPAPWPPVVGQECEYKGVLDAEWLRVMITSIQRDEDGDVWYRHSGEKFGFGIQRFRPLTHPAPSLSGAVAGPASPEPKPQAGPALSTLREGEAPKAEVARPQVSTPLDIALSPTKEVDHAPVGLNPATSEAAAAQVKPQSASEQGPANFNPGDRVLVEAEFHRSDSFGDTRFLTVTSQFGENAHWAKTEHVHPASILDDLAAIKAENERLKHRVGNRVSLNEHSEVLAERDTLRTENERLKEDCEAREITINLYRSNSKLMESYLAHAREQNRAQVDRAEKAERELETARDMGASVYADVAAERDAAYALLWEVVTWCEDHESPINLHYGVVPKARALLASQPAETPEPAAWVPKVGELLEVVNVSKPDVSHELEIGAVCKFKCAYSDRLWDVERIDGKNIPAGGFYPHRFRPLPTPAPEPEREPWIDLNESWDDDDKEIFQQIRSAIDELRAKVGA